MSHKTYIFQQTEENGKTITQYNNHKEYNLKTIVRLFISGHELKQNKSKISAITASTYKLIKDSAAYLTETKETSKQSIHETLRQKKSKILIIV